MSRHTNTHTIIFASLADFSNQAGLPEAPFTETVSRHDQAEHIFFFFFIQINPFTKIKAIFISYSNS